MFPEGLPEISLRESEGDFLYPRSKKYPKTESWDSGGVGLSDPSEDLTKYSWFSWTDGLGIFLKRDDLEEVSLIITDRLITEIDLTFDQNMRPCVSYVSDGVSKLYWYDALKGEQVTTSFPEARTPRVSLDDKRRFNVANSDVIFVYVKGRNIYYRLQRERYSIERLIYTSPIEDTLKVFKIGMGEDRKFLIETNKQTIGKDVSQSMQLARLAYPEAAWVASCGNGFPSRVQWLHKYLSKVDVLPSKDLKDKLPDSGYPNTTSVVMKNRATVGSGKTSEGVPIHEQVSLDWVKWAISRKVWRLLYTKDKISATEGGKELIVNEVKDVLNIAVEEGIFVKYDISDVILNSRNNTISIKFSAELEHTILYVDVSGSLYH